MNVLMLYTSMTGNTELMAESMIDKLKMLEINLDVKLFEDNEVEVKDLLNYDIIFFGLYTWVGGDVPLEVEDFFDNLFKIDLSGRVFGVFGSADSDYPDYGTAIEMLYEQVKRLGGSMIEPLIVDEEPTAADINRCQHMVNAALLQISNNRRK